MSTNRYKNIPNNTVSRNLRKFDEKTGNIYESIAIISKRADQIASQIKEEIHERISEFNTSADSLEEIYENKEQIEVSKYYEQFPKPSLIATEEFLEDKIYFRKR